MEYTVVMIKTEDNLVSLYAFLESIGVEYEVLEEGTC